MNATLDPELREYVRAVLGLYVQLPGTRHAASRQDRRLAATLYARGIPLSVVRAALLLTAARRTLRRKDAPPLPPVSCLHYFLPVLEETIQTPPDPGYVEYLDAKLRPLMKPGPPAQPPA